MPPDQTTTSDAVPPVGGVETILLVEDEPAVRRIIRQILDRGGYTVIEAADGLAALAKAEEHRGTIELLLTDMVMPGMPTAELVALVRKLRSGIRVLCISGHSDDPVSGQSIPTGAAYLQKPFSISGLSLKVREVLDAD